MYIHIHKNLLHDTNTLNWSVKFVLFNRVSPIDCVPCKKNSNNAIRTVQVQKLLPLDPDPPGSFFHFCTSLLSSCVILLPIARACPSSWVKWRGYPEAWWCLVLFTSSPHHQTHNPGHFSWEKKGKKSKSQLHYPKIIPLGGFPFPLLSFRDASRKGCHFQEVSV